MVQISKETKIDDILKLGQLCNRENNCCKHGSGFLIGNDLKNIAQFLGMQESEVKEKYLEEKELFNTKLFRPKLKTPLKKIQLPYGECIFFSGDGCKIHEVKPLQCKIGNCSKYGEELSLWFMLNYVVNEDDPESIRQYAIYLKSGGKTIAGGELERLVPDKERLKKILRYEESGGCK